MDTVLNLGLNDTVVEGLAAKRGERFAYDCYRRLLDMFGDVVLGIEHSEFEEQIHAVKVGLRGWEWGWGQPQEVGRWVWVRGCRRRVGCDKGRGRGKGKASKTKLPLRSAVVASVAQPTCTRAPLP